MLKRVERMKRMDLNSVLLTDDIGYVPRFSDPYWGEGPFVHLSCLPNKIYTYFSRRLDYRCIGCGTDEFADLVKIMDTTCRD